jgi:hypothetical protein
MWYDHYQDPYYQDPNEVGYYPDWMIQQDVEKAWQEHELANDVNALEREIAIRRIERDYQIERIAKEARTREISLKIIFKFFVDYSLSEADRVKFWLSYYGL